MNTANIAHRKQHTIGQSYGVLQRAVYLMPVLKKAIQAKLITQQFKERIMLAVTEVNGCALCSFAHTNMALEAGMSPEEIHSMLQGEMPDVPPQELPGILFGQHYADTKGNPSVESWQRIQELYGPETADAILSATCVIMAGNIFGAPLGSLQGRIFSDKKQLIDSRSSVGYEIGMLLATILFVPVAVVHTLLLKLSKHSPSYFIS